MTPVLLVLKDTNIIWHVNRVFATSVCETIQITVIKHELTKKQMKVKTNRTSFYPEIVACITTRNFHQGRFWPIKVSYPDIFKLKSGVIYVYKEKTCSKDRALGDA